jgi:hypothetical protein
MVSGTQFISNVAIFNGGGMFVGDAATLHSLGCNLVETTTNCTMSGMMFGNVTGQDPLLGPLQNNGGSTPMQALLPGSPALDAGQIPYCSDGTGAPITTDQRGFRRPIGARCDIGAVEYSPYALDLPLVHR